MDQPTLWVIEQVNDEKFPYRLTLRKEDNILLALRVQERWPGQKGNVFCIREETREWPPPQGEIERVPVISLKRFGKRLSIILDRPQNKRCDFLFLTKKYKKKEGEYEQIFWRTQRALRERRPKVKLSTYYGGNLNIIIDVGERYSWKFPGCTVRREKLPVGDYALSYKDKIIAVVERKTFENILAELSRMSSFHQQLAELSAYKHSALVIEANYSDFLNPDKLKFYTPSFLAMAIGELYALHPGLTIIFAGNRKLAMEWTFRFFSAISAHENDTPHTKISEVVESWGLPSKIQGGISYEIKNKIKNEFPEVFTVSTIKEHFPTASESIIKKVLYDLKKDNLLRREGKGSKSVWIKQEINTIAQ